MNTRYIYDVRVLGVSIGLTFNHAEAVAWYMGSGRVGREKAIGKMPYQVL